MGAAPQLLRCRAAPSGDCSDGGPGRTGRHGAVDGGQGGGAARLHRRDDSGRQRPAPLCSAPACPLRSAPSQAAGTAKRGHPNCWATSQRRRAAQERRTRRRAAVPRHCSDAGRWGWEYVDRIEEGVGRWPHPSAWRLASNPSVGTDREAPPARATRQAPTPLDSPVADAGRHDTLLGGRSHAAGRNTSCVKHGERRKGQRSFISPISLLSFKFYKCA
jgi:hypothetical protein